MVYVLVPCLIVICVCGIFLGISWAVILRDRHFKPEIKGEDEDVELKRIDKDGEIIEDL